VSSLKNVGDLIKVKFFAADWRYYSGLFGPFAAYSALAMSLMGLFMYMSFWMFTYALLVGIVIALLEVPLIYNKPQTEGMRSRLIGAGLNTTGSKGFVYTFASVGFFVEDVPTGMIAGFVVLLTGLCNLFATFVQLPDGQGSEEYGYSEAAVQEDTTSLQSY
jgi:hypothetical protein